MTRDFAQIAWDSQLEDDCRQLVRLAVREDLDRSYDLTTVTLVGEDDRAAASVVARQSGILAGAAAVGVAIDEMEADVQWEAKAEDGEALESGSVIGVLSGAARDMLTCERILLNLLGRLCGIATRANHFVQAAEGTAAGIYDTRKTTPGWRRLEKYAIRCGGGRNHRTGLFDAVLIKDNHLAVSTDNASGPSEAIGRVRERLPDVLPQDVDASQIIIEVEVDTFEQFKDALAASPDIILLDNMSPELMKEAVAFRNSVNADVQLEASGGIRLDTIAAVAASGVERISVGGLTHSAISLDIALDWIQ